MPELPEVETVANQLNAAVAGRTIEKVVILDEKLRALPTRELEGAKILGVRRVGKQVVLMCRRAEPIFLATHLRMSGRLLWAERCNGSSWDSARSLVREHARGGDPQRHIRAQLFLSGGELHFVDPRRFGTMALLQDLSPLERAGLDPVSAEFTVTRLAQLLATSRQPLKQWLLRQDRLVGIGNIYASEILFAAAIHPRRPASSLSADEVRALSRAIKHVLKKAIRHCGTTFSDFQHADGSEGSFQRFLKVYAREGERCRRCVGTIEREVSGQRSTFFCRSCQR